MAELERYYFTYCYLQRLSNSTVLHGAIRKAAEEGKIALAASFDGNRYVDLKMGKDVPSLGDIGGKMLVVNKDAAQRQIDEEKPKTDGGGGEHSGEYGGNDDGRSDPGKNESGGQNGKGNGTLGEKPVDKPAVHLHKYFYLNRQMDNDRLMEECKKYVLEIARLLQDTGADFTVHMNIEADKTDGFSTKTETDITENCNSFSLKPGDEYGFQDSRE